MAIFAIPGLISLVTHSSGGAILSTATGGYISGTLIPPAVVASAPAIAVGAVLVTAAAAGTYLYLHGIPAPIGEFLANKGFVSAADTVAETFSDATAETFAEAAAQTVFAVSAGDIVLVLTALAAVGYFVYTHSESVKNWVDDLAGKAQGEAEDLVQSLNLSDLIHDLKSILSRLMRSAKAFVKTLWKS